MKYQKYSLILSLFFLLLLITNCSDENCVNSDDTPRIIATYPANGAVDVKTDTTYSITFDRIIDRSDISSATFTIESPFGLVDAVVALVDDSIVTITPYQPMVGHAVHTIRVDKGVRDEDGKQLGTAYALTFTTGTTQLLVYPDIEYTIRDNNGDDNPDEILLGGPPGRFLQSGVNGLVSDRAVIEFPLDQLVYDDVLEAIVFITLSSTTVDNGVARIESWGFIGNNSGELTDWDNGSQTLALDNQELNAQQTIALPIVDFVNSALASGATHVGIRFVVTGEPVVEIATTGSIDDEYKARLFIEY